MITPQLESKRLLLTWPNQNQITQYYNDIINSNMFDTIQWDGPTGPEELFSYWDNAFTIDYSDLRQSIDFAVIEKSNNNYIGGVSYRPINLNSCHCDIGYAFAPKYHGQGFATEAVNLLVNEAFTNRKAERIVANIFVGNEASKNVVSKLGFLYEGTLRRFVKKGNQWKDEWLMAITRPDWEGRKRTKLFSEF